MIRSMINIVGLNQFYVATILIEKMTKVNIMNTRLPVSRFRVLSQKGPKLHIQNSTRRCKILTLTTFIHVSCFIHEKNALTDSFIFITYGLFNVHMY